MLNMDMSIISKEFIRPSSPSIHHQEPLKLSLLDQLAPAVHSPLILFYPTTNTHFKNAQFSTQLKSSLSQTLSTFYPLSGRVKANHFIDNYEEGVQYTEARVKGYSLFDFLKDPDQIGSLNHLLPFQPFSTQLDQEKVAQVAVQVNIFDCGGVALGLSMLHKIIDGATVAAFLNSWAANARRSGNKKIAPDFFQASMRFPPQDPTSLLQAHLSSAAMFNEGKYITKRFVFDAKTIANLREMAKSERVDNPSRIEALSSFIWKCCTEASRSLSPSPRPSLSIHAVDIRQRASPYLPRYSVGNLLFQATAAYDHLADKEMGLVDSVVLTRESFKNINKDYINTFQGEKGFQAMSKLLANQLKEIGSKNPETFCFSSWIKFPFNDLDFGWGKPIWSGVSGEVGAHFTNAIVFKESGRNKEIEAWMILDENIMSTVERDAEFLKFASPNPPLSI